MTLISYVGELVFLSVSSSFTLALGVGSCRRAVRSRSNPDPKEVAAKSALNLTSQEQRRWLREFFIHCERGEANLWMPLMDPQVNSLIEDGLIDNLGGFQNVFKYGPLSQFRLNPYARKVMLDSSDSSCHYNGCALLEEHGSSEFERWSEVTFRVRHMPWRADASSRYRFRSLDRIGFARSNLRFDPSRPLFFESLQCMSLNGDPVGVVHQQASANARRRVNSIRGRMPPEEANFIGWLFS